VFITILSPFRLRLPEVSNYVTKRRPISYYTAFIDYVSQLMSYVCNTSLLIWFDELWQYSKLSLNIAQYNDAISWSSLCDNFLVTHIISDRQVSYFGNVHLSINFCCVFILCIFVCIPLCLKGTRSPYVQNPPKSPTIPHAILYGILSNTFFV